MTSKYHYSGKNYKLIDHPLNVTFDAVLKMSKNEFLQWCIDFRKLVVKLWDEEGLPPRIGYNKEDIVDNFNKLLDFDPTQLLVTDELTGEDNVIRNNTILGNAVNSWFPTMMKTRINYNKNDDGRSIYDFFAQDALLDKFHTYAKRHFKRDSFYHYSSPVTSNDRSHAGDLPFVNGATDWIVSFESDFRKIGDYDYWLAPKNVEKGYTGYNEKLKERVNLLISREEINRLVSLGLIPAHCASNVEGAKHDMFEIRAFLRNQKLFPVGLKAFRVSFCQ